MMKFSKLIASASFALLTAVAAHATPVTGSISLSGNDTFTSSSVTFNPTTGSVISSSGSLATYAAPSTTFNLGSFSFSTSASATGTNGQAYGGAANDVLFATIPTAAGMTNLAFTIGSITATTYANGFLYVAGTGVFTETGYSATTGTFSLTTSSTGTTSFQISSGVSSVTPEPNSLVLMGTGLVGAAGILMMRRRRNGFSL